RRTWFRIFPISCSAWALSATPAAFTLLSSCRHTHTHTHTHTHAHTHTHTHTHTPTNTHTHTHTHSLLLYSKTNRQRDRQKDTHFLCSTCSTSCHLSHIYNAESCQQDFESDVPSRLMQ